MRKILYGFICISTVLSFQGCFWHSSTEKIVEPTGASSTTVVTPGPSTTVSTSQ